MEIEDISDLYAYNDWANERVRTSIGVLTQEAYERELSASFGSVKGTVVHLVSAQWAWLKRWKGQLPQQPLSDELFESPELANCRWAEVDQDLANYVAALDGQELQQTITYTRLKGKSISNLLWQAMLHVVNHSSYHRGQIASLLRQVQSTPQSTDLIRYYYEKDKSMLSSPKGLKGLK